MKNRFLLVLMVIALLVPVAVLVSSSSEGADPVAPPFYGVTGYVTDTERNPMKEVSVTIMDSRAGGASYPTEITNDEGFFRIVVAYYTNLSISFDCKGHEIISCPNTVRQSDGTLSLNLATAQYDSSKRTYQITSDADGMQTAIMAKTNGTIIGVVSYANGTIKNATVSIWEPDEERPYKEVRTNDRGGFEIEKCPTGLYYISARGDGFLSSEREEIKVTSSTITKNITLERIDQPKILGMDYAHLFMLVGVIVGILLAVSAWFLSKRMNEEHEFEVIDDTVEEQKKSEVSDEP